MKRIACLLGTLCFAITTTHPHAQTTDVRIIVRASLGISAVQTLCARLGCTVNYGLGDPGGQVFLITANTPSPGALLTTLALQAGIIDAEMDVKGNIRQGGTTSSAPPALSDQTPVSFYGETVWDGYLNQPASQIVRASDARSSFQVAGAGTVAVIDTGVDPNQPVLQPVLLPGYDFTRNRDGGSEIGDIQQSTADVVDGVGPTFVNSATMAVIDQSTADVVDSSQYSAFGHGTMVAGIVHLVAPRAFILPLKAFGPDGTGYTSDAIRAIYWAVHANAQVLNMSFSFANASAEFSNALRYANEHNVIAVAAAGNDGQEVAVYPAAYASYVMGVASTTNSDTRSSFSNYGQPQVWVAAPGEWIVSTYPWGTYAASSGTSFSAPFVAGTAALLLDVNTGANESGAAQAITHAKFISPDLGNGRLDIYQAVAAWRQALGMQ